MLVSSSGSSTTSAGISTACVGDASTNSSEDDDKEAFLTVEARRVTSGPFASSNVLLTRAKDRVKGDADDSYQSRRRSRAITRQKKKRKHH
jgi:hypothetical protein